MPDIAVTVSPIFPTMAVAMAVVASTPGTFAPAVPGAGGAAASISTDADNALVQGIDEGLFVPEAFAVSARLSEIAGNETAKTEVRQNLDLQNIDCGTFS